ncbi:hypothetical protein FB451DRAFT_1033208 [Mycena latifolia]|nr:hypothetical protein FB451DRAFT_1033208 [Mycena latifolia]
MLYLAIEDSSIILDLALHITAGDDRHRFALRGVIYSGSNHFTARIIKEDGTIWYHDGIETGNKCEYDGQFNALPPLALNTCITEDATRTVAAVIYARSEFD